jgi:hypothetical protein
MNLIGVLDENLGNCRAGNRSEMTYFMQDSHLKPILLHQFKHRVLKADFGLVKLFQVRIREEFKAVIFAASRS